MYKKIFIQERILRKKKEKNTFPRENLLEKKIMHWPKKIHLSLHGLKITFKQGKC